MNVRMVIIVAGAVIALMFPIALIAGYAEYTRGRDAAEMYRWMTARDAYRAAIRWQPRNAAFHHALGAHMLTGRAYGEQRKNNMQAGLHALQEAVQLSPHEGRYHLDLARAYILLEEFDAQAGSRAEEHLHDALRRDPGNAYYKFVLIDFYAKRGRWEDATTLMRTTVEAYPGRPFFDAVLAEDWSRRPEMLRALGEGLATNPDADWYRSGAVVLAKLHHERREWEDAGRWWLETIRVDKNPGSKSWLWLHQNGYEALLRSGDADGLGECLASLVSVFPADRRIRVLDPVIELARTKTCSGCEEVLLDGFLKARDHAPDEPAFQYFAGWVAFERKNFEKARRIAELLSDIGDAHYLLYRLDQNAGNDDEAYAHIQTAAELAGVNPQYHYIVALQALERKDIRRALPALHNATRTGGEHWLYEEAYGDVAMVLEDYTGALRRYTQALKLNPPEDKRHRLHAKAGQAYFEMGDLSASLTEMKRARSMAPHIEQYAKDVAALQDYVLDVTKMQRTAQGR